MERKRKLLLVFPRMKYPSGDFSLGLAALSAYLKKSVPDIAVSLLDTTFHRSFRFARKALLRERPAVVGIYVDTIMYGSAVKIASMAREAGCHVVAGGPHASLMPESLLETGLFDAVVIGEGEVSFSEYLGDVFREGDPEGVAGIALWRNGEVRRTEPREPVEDLNGLPDPDLDIFDVERYIGAFVQLDSYDAGLRGISMIVSRGCPFDCAYCQPTLRRMFGRRLRILSPERVVGMIRRYREQYGIEAVYFQDDTLTVFRKWMGEFCDLMSRDGPPVVWACNTRADTVDSALLRRMRDAGCVKIKVGIEAASKRVREDIYRKGITLDQVDGLVSQCRELGIQVAGFFMLGAPTETEEEVRQTIRYAIQSDLTEANFSVATPLPCTHLYVMARERGWCLPETFADYDYYQVSGRAASGADIGRGKLAALKKIANAGFYLHPKRVPALFRSISSVKGMRKLRYKIARV